MAVEMEVSGGVSDGAVDTGDDSVDTGTLEGGEEHASVEQDDSQQEQVDDGQHSESVAQQIKKYKRKINGKEVEMTKEEIFKEWQEDFDKNPDQYLDLAQLRRASHERHSNATNLEKSIKAFTEKLTKDTRTALKEAGIDPVEWAKQTIYEEVQREQMPEAERKAYDLEKENRTLKEETERYRKEREQQKKQLEVQRMAEDYRRKFESALESGGMKSDKEGKLLAIMSEIEQQNYMAQKDDIAAGLQYRPLEPSQLVTELKKRLEYYGNLYSGIQKTSQEQERIKRVEQFKNKNDGTQTAQARESQYNPERQSGLMTISEVIKYQREKGR